jgi:hypothetical protein
LLNEAKEEFLNTRIAQEGTTFVLE